jgi:hypothetical protein
VCCDLYIYTYCFPFFVHVRYVIFRYIYLMSAVFFLSFFFMEINISYIYIDRHDEQRTLENVFYWRKVFHQSNKTTKSIRTCFRVHIYLFRKHRIGTDYFYFLSLYSIWFLFFTKKKEKFSFRLV